jgi:hypothetical protein
MGAPCTLLLDNGSIFAESARNLRRLASELAARTGKKIHPVSLLHSSAVDPAKLGGEPAWIFEPYLKERYDRFGEKSFLVVPLFFGPSAALVEYLPRRIRALRAGRPGLEVRIAPCLVQEDGEGKEQIAGILADLVEERIAEKRLNRPVVAMVDHGTPTVGVNRMRDAVAGRLRETLGNRVAGVRPCSMERREGDAFDFNEPLLENLLGQPGYDRDVVVSMLFLSPGRHARPGGDVDCICREAQMKYPGLRVFLTSLVGSHPKLIDLLAMRLEQGLK